MRLTIELTPEQGAQLRAAAKTRGIDYTEMAREIVADHLPAVTPGDVVASQLEEAALTVDAENAAAIAYLKARLAAGANAGAEEVRQVEEEYEEIKRNLNANRAATGERLVFP